MAIVVPRLGTVAAGGGRAAGEVLDAIGRYVRDRLRDRPSQVPEAVVAEVPIAAGDEVVGAVMLLAGPGKGVPRPDATEFLHLAAVAVVLDDRRIEVGVDRLPGDADVHALQRAVCVEPGGELAHRDRPVVVVLHVLLAAPDQLHRSAGELLGDGDGLAGGR